MGLACASLTAFLIVATAGFVEPGELCPQPALSPAVVIHPPGANVTLPCPEGELENTTAVYWKLNGRNISSHGGKQSLAGSHLFLPSVYYNDSGSYSCHAGERVLHSVRLLVEERPEVPDFTCFRRSFDMDILCEWRPSRQVSSRTKAKLWVQKGLMGGNLTEQPCRRYSKSQKFSCRIVMTHQDDDITLQVTMCVINLAGAESRGTTFFGTSSLVKPDPPENVRVSPVEKAPHKLLVTWRYPSSWSSTIYYRLRFQLRYRTDVSQTYSEVELPLEATSHMIHDALKNHLYRVQVRAHEEFDYGKWSEWSRESIGTPWTEPPEPASETVSNISEVAADYPFVTPDVSAPPEFPINPAKPADAMDVALHTFLIPVITVILGLILIVGIVVRYRKKWHALSSGEGKPKPIPPYSLVPLGSSPPLSASPLLSPPASPFSESSVDSPRILENGPYDVSNADYFLLPR